MADECTPVVTSRIIIDYRNIPALWVKRSIVLHQRTLPASEGVGSRQTTGEQELERNLIDTVTAKTLVHSLLQTGTEMVCCVVLVHTCYARITKWLVNCT